MRNALAIVALMGLATVAALLVSAFTPGPPPTPPERVFAFLSRADGRELTRLRQVGRLIDVVAPNWYEIDVDSGALQRPWDRDPVIRAARRAGAALWPVVNARTGGSLALDDARARERVAQAIARVASEPEHAGVTLDIEELLPTQKASYTALVRRVVALVRPRGRRVAVYVSRPTTGGSALAYDWPALAAAADLVLVSTYNETGPGGPPGPLDSRAGFDSVLDRAAAVSRTKAVPILAAIGYAWPRAGGRGQMVSTVDADRRRARCGATRTVRDGNASWSCRGEVVHHATAAGLRARARAAGGAGFRWFALFSLGREPRSFWDEMARRRR